MRRVALDRGLILFLPFNLGVSLSLSGYWNDWDKVIPDRNTGIAAWLSMDVAYLVMLRVVCGDGSPGQDQGDATTGSRMTISISTSDDPESIWMVQSAVYVWFANLVAENDPEEQDLLHRLEMGLATNGIPLDLLQAEHPELAERLRAALHRAAAEVAEGRHDAALAEEFGLHLVGSFQAIFEELAAMLAKWPGDKAP